jgi:hypothetical protein
MKDGKSIENNLKETIKGFPEQAGYLGKTVIISPKYPTDAFKGEIEAKVLRDDKSTRDSKFTDENICMIFQLEDGKCLYNTEVNYYRLEE